MASDFTESDLLGNFFSQINSTHIPKTEVATSRVWRSEHASVEYSTRTDMFEGDRVVCISLGQPRFSDPELRKRANNAGPSAAWTAAFNEHGADAPKNVRGRFSVALLSLADNRIFAATDRFATYPICYSISDDGIRLGDNAKDVAGSQSSISIQSVFDYLFHHVIPAPATIFKEVSRLPPSHVLIWAPGNIQCRRYWSPEFTSRALASVDDQAERFLSIVESAVSRESESGTVGAFLSGGTDSSTIAGMLCKVTGQAASTYSIGFDASGYDEVEYARIAAKHFGSDHHEYYVTPEDLVTGIPKVAGHYDQPFGNSSSVPALICAARARSHGIDKLLAGDGGDELFGGNERYAKQKIFERYASVPGVLRSYLLEPMSNWSGIDRIPIAKKAASYVRQAQVPLPDRLHSYNLLLRIGTNEVLEKSFLAEIDVRAPVLSQRRWWEGIDAESTVDRMIAFDWKYTLSDNDLPKVVGTSELAGIDVGFPLLDDELLEFSLELPAEWKLKGRSLRWFFKYALRDFLPEAILKKQKHGFGLPFGVWACTNSELKSLAKHALRNLGERGVVRREFLETLLDHHLPAHPGYFGEMVWILMMLELWLEDNAPSWTVSR